MSSFIFSYPKFFSMRAINTASGICGKNATDNTLLALVATIIPIPQHNSHLRQAKIIEKCFFM